jgi:hypothetical protein
VIRLTFTKAPHRALRDLSAGIARSETLIRMQTRIDIKESYRHGRGHDPSRKKLVPCST